MSSAMYGEDQRKHFELAVNILRDGLRGLLILNGGAAVALMALAGSSEHTNAINVPLLGRSIVAFGSGAVLSLLVTLLAYVAQLHFANSERFKDNQQASRLYYWQYRILKNAAWLVAVLPLILTPFLGVFWAGEAVGVFQ
jgi:hypothetical protein